MISSILQDNELYTTTQELRVRSEYLNRMIEEAEREGNNQNAVHYNTELRRTEEQLLQKLSGGNHHVDPIDPTLPFALADLLSLA